jgi:hypothetical protein
VLASNRLAVALSPRLQPGYNRLRSLLLDPEEQAFQQDWTRSAEGFIAAFRKSIGDDIDNPRFVELVGELALSSERFQALWARHDIRGLDGGTTTVNHPVVGELRLHRDKLPVDDVLLVLYYADQGSESDEKLRLLASRPRRVSDHKRLKYPIPARRSRHHRRPRVMIAAQAGRTSVTSWLMSLILRLYVGGTRRPRRHIGA